MESFPRRGDFAIDFGGAYEQERWDADSDRLIRQCFGGEMIYLIIKVVVAAPFTHMMDACRQVNHEFNTYQPWCPVSGRGDLTYDDIHCTLNWLRRFSKSPHNRVAPRDQLPNHRPADETGRSGYQDSHDDAPSRLL
jgi:hypothetical protein